MNPFIADRRLLVPHFHKIDDPSESSRSILRIATFNRINAMAAIMSARHGWIGASFSVAEILAVLYHALGERNVVLSKGHAAAMQYACLYAIGTLDRGALLAYKNGPGAPQAHTDRVTPGILLSTGSLGQSPSKIAGMARERPTERFFVIVGDGELQEGQVWEAFQTLCQGKIPNVTVIIDRNQYQTSATVDETKGIAHLVQTLANMGFRVRSVEGHDPGALCRAFSAPAKGPLLIVADTVKAAGSPLLAPVAGQQPWHARIPDDALYRRILAGLVAAAECPDLAQEHQAWCESTVDRGPVLPSKARSTRDGFAGALPGLLDAHPEMVVLDADLAGSCGLTNIADPKSRFAQRGQFVEMGIAEQDMVSFAGGQALAGRLPVVHTYAAFFRRAVDQIHLNLHDDARVLYVGHYAGLCYHTDGVTHQSLEDLGLFHALPGISVYEPATPEQAADLADWLVMKGTGSAYIRLRRAPMDLPLVHDPEDPARPILHGTSFQRCFITIGTVSTRLALDCIATPEFADWGLVVVASLDATPHLDTWRRIMGEVREIISIEEDRSGVLRSMILDLVARLADDRPMPRLRSLRPSRPSWSFRTLRECLDYHGFTVQAVRDR